MANVTAQHREEARRLLNDRLDFGDTSRILATVIAERDEARAAAAEGRAYYDEVCARSVRERDVLYGNHVKELTDLRERAAQVAALGAHEGPVYCSERECVAAAIRELPLRRDDDAR